MRDIRRIFSVNTCFLAASLFVALFGKVEAQIVVVPQINNMVRTVCSGENVNVTPANGIDGIVPVGTTYSWTVVSGSGVGMATSGSSGSSGTMFLGTLANTTLSPATVVYSIIPVNGGNTGSSFQLSVTVNPELNVSLTGDYDTYCSGSNSHLAVAVLPSGSYIYDWYADNTFVATGSSNTFTSTGLAPRSLAYTYKVIVKSSAGCEGTSNDFAVTAKNLPVANVTLNHTDICPDGSITATINVIPTDNYNYKWYFNSVESGYQNQFTVDNLSVSTHFVYAEVISDAAYNGCDVNSGVVTFEVHANPVVYIAADDAAICAGDTAVIKTINVVQDLKVKKELNYTWQWALNGSEIGNAVQNTYRQMLTNAGTYNFSVRMKQNDDLGCASDWSAPVTVTVEDIPHVSLVSDDRAYCAGGSINLSVSAVPVASTYDWYVDNVLSASGRSDTFVSQENARATYIYHVIARSALGCEGISNHVCIEVKDLPTVAVTADYTDICPDGSITVTANAAPTDNYDYKWYKNNIEIGYQQQLNLHDLSVGRDTVYVKASPVVHYNGCEAVSTPIILTIHPNPVATVFASNTSLCDEGAVFLSSSINLSNRVRDDNNLAYYWSLDGTIIDGAVQSSYLQLLEQGIYSFAMRVVQNDDLGCASDWSAPVVVTVSHTEVPSFITTDCKEDNVSAQNYHIINIPIDVQTGNPRNYAVNFVNTNYAALRHFGLVRYSQPLDAYIEARLPLQAGDYELIVDIDGCQYTTTARVLVDENAMDGAKLIEQRWGDVLTVNNNPATNGGFAFYAYQWYKDNVFIPGANKQFYTEPDGKLDGTYCVALHGYAILSSNDTVEVSYVSCPFVPTVDFSVAVYPVPTQKNQPLTFSTSLSAAELTDARLEICDVMGVVKRQITTVRPEMSIEGFEHGVYFGRLTTKNNGTHNFKFVVVE